MRRLACRVMASEHEICAPLPERTRRIEQETNSLASCVKPLYETFLRNIADVAAAPLCPATPESLTVENFNFKKSALLGIRTRPPTRIKRSSSCWEMFGAKSEESFCTCTRIAQQNYLALSRAVVGTTAAPGSVRTQAARYARDLC